MLELVPGGHELVPLDDAVELAVYVDERVAAHLRNRMPGLTVVDVPAGWTTEWKRFHAPVRVGPLWIGPPWEPRPPGATPVVIDPGRAFGTGAHATTRLCLELLLGVERGSLLDVGCGSGVLSVAAGKLGFSPLTAVDVDGAAVEATARNAAVNGVVLTTLHADALTADLPAADVAVANIELAAVEALARRLVCRNLVTSGYLAVERPSVVGFAHVERRSTEAWAADLYVRK